MNSEVILIKIVIIGGVAGGASAAARLRRLDEQAQIIMFERGEFISFANCGLPYYIGEDIKERDELELQTPDSFNARFNVDVRTFSQVVEINRSNKKLTVENTTTGEIYTESYDKLILSPGAKPVIPPIKGADNAKVFTVRTIPDAVKIKEYIDHKKPTSAAVVGGGYIGVEMAENLKNIGLDVTIIEMSDHVIASLDYDMACDVHNYLRKKGICLQLSNGLESIVDQEEKLTLKLKSGALSVDMIIMAVGVQPESELARQSGLITNERGAIITNEYMSTSDEDIYAVGDAVEVTELVTGEKSYIPLAGPANKQGRIAADNICGIKSRYKGTQGSAVLKIFDMTVAVTGITEATAKARNINYDKSFTLSSSHAGYYPGSNDMSIKTIYEKNTGRIIGAQIVGYDGVDKRSDVFSVAIRAGLTAYDLTEMELCYAPPFSSAKDPVNFAGYVIENLLLGRVKQFHWNDVDKLPRDGTVNLLDVRTPLEYEDGHINGFINIELDTLRESIGNLDLKKPVLDKSKPVYVHCRSGLRSYIACRILTQSGYDCYNLSGGYRLYDSVVGGKAAEKFSCNVK